MDRDLSSSSFLSRLDSSLRSALRLCLDSFFILFSSFLNSFDFTLDESGVISLSVRGGDRFLSSLEYSLSGGVDCRLLRSLE